MYNSISFKKNKRINNEILSLLDNYNNISIDKINNSINIKKDNLDIKFILPFDYPFKSPQVYINNKSYLKMLATKSNFFLDEITKNYNIKCLCCNTILCSGKWYPSLKIESILHEINENKNIILNISKKYWLNKILEKNNIYCLGLKDYIFKYIND